MAEWVALAERFPKPEDLRRDGNGFCCLLIWSMEGWEIHGYNDARTTIDELHKQRERYRITHWMTLPEMPDSVRNQP